MGFLKTFSPVCGLPFHSVNMSFAEQNILILMESCLSIFSFMNHAFDVVSKKSSSNPRASRFSVT